MRKMPGNKRLKVSFDVTVQTHIVRTVLFLFMFSGCVFYSGVAFGASTSKEQQVRAKKVNVNPQNRPTFWRTLPKLNPLQWHAQRFIQGASTAEGPFFSFLKNKTQKTPIVFRAQDFSLSKKLFLSLFFRSMKTRQIPLSGCSFRDPKKIVHIRNLRSFLLRVVLMGQEATRRGLRVDTQTVLKGLLKGFTPKAKQTQKERIKRLLQTDIFQLERLCLLARKMRLRIRNSIHVSMQDIQDRYTVRNTKITMSYFRVRPKAYRPPIQLSLEQINRYIRTHEKEIRKEYAKNRSFYFSPEKIRVSTLTLRFHRYSQPSVKEFTALYARMIRIRARELKSPGTIQKLAVLRKNPMAIRSGSTRWMVQDDGSSLFSRTAFALKNIGDLSPIFFTSRGLHIMQLVQKKKAKQNTLWQPSTRRKIARTLLLRELRVFRLQKEVHSALQLLKKDKKHFLQRLKKHTSIWFRRALEHSEYSTEAFHHVDSAYRLRGVGTVDREWVNRAFALKTPGEVMAQASDIEGMLYLFVLKSKHKPSRSEFHKKQKDLKKKYLVRRWRTLCNRTYRWVRKRTSIQ